MKVAQAAAIRLFKGLTITKQAEAALQMLLSLAMAVCRLHCFHNDSVNISKRMRNTGRLVLGTVVSCSLFKMPHDHKCIL